MVAYIKYLDAYSPGYTISTSAMKNNHDNLITNIII